MAGRRKHGLISAGESVTMLLLNTTSFPFCFPVQKIRVRWISVAFFCSLPTFSNTLWLLLKAQQQKSPNAKQSLELPAALLLKE